MQYHYSSIGSSIWEFLFFSSNYKVIPFQFYKLINSVKFLLTLILDSNLWKKATETKAPQPDNNEPVILVSSLCLKEH